MPPSDPPRSLRREATLTRALLAVSVAAAAMLALDVGGVLLERIRTGTPGAIAEQVLFAAIAAALLYGNLVYQVSRIGALERGVSYRRTPLPRLERVHDEPDPPALAILIPAYREEPEVVRRTLLSAAFQDHPRRRVVLLIDDPPEPADPDAAASLAALRQLPRHIAERLDKPASSFAAALAGFERRRRDGAFDLLWETQCAAQLCAEAAAWFDAAADAEVGEGHAERFFRDAVLRSRARELAERGLGLEAAVARREPVDVDLLLLLHRRLAALFRVEIASFERKRYANLSHTANKAMNLNAYLGLLGRSFREIRRADGLHLEDADAGDGPIRVGDADFVITLDADSILAPEYALVLLAQVRAPGAERVAVIQTPYSAFPEPPGVLERVAGATTDVQYGIHQGFTRWGATYWVGANALLRVEALRAISTHRRERGFDVPVFIDDRTVIEDTESSIDLIGAGWTLHNVPERLAWSATPPDFGSLLIQRRRWANGGLLILPKLLRALARQSWTVRSAAEGFLRIHYLVSIATVNASLVTLLAWPFDQALRSLWFPVASIPYFALYGRELVRLGYPVGDLARAYALNLLLVPVNLAGVGHSLLQAATGRKAAFARTPKVPGRTATPAAFHGAGAILGVGLAVVFAMDLARGYWIHASFVAANGAAFGYAMARFVGGREIREDLRLAWSARRRPAGRRPGRSSDASGVTAASACGPIRRP